MGLICCFVFSGCDSIYRLLDKEGAEEKALIGDVVPFENNPKVEEVQALLYLYGYNVGKVDGILGLRTRNAIEKFQKDNHLEPSRFADTATWNNLVDFSSGRLEQYTERLSSLEQRDIIGQLLGNGPGSDVTFSRQWWWEAKGSHNDFLQHIREDGVIGLLGIIIYIIGNESLKVFDSNRLI